MIGKSVCKEYLAALFLKARINNFGKKNIINQKSKPPEIKLKSQESGHKNQKSCLKIFLV